MQYYHVKNWQRFQHYKDRNPPWIKLHYEIMTSEDWVMLADAGKLLAVVCMLVASRNEGRIPADPHYFKRVAYLDKLPDFKPLLSCGFLENSLADASESKQMLANARPETETYRTEEETEKESKIPPTPLPEWLPLPEWDAFKQARKKMRAPLTDKAEQIAISQLETLKAQGNDPKAVLEQSIMRGWKGLFPLKNDNQRGKQHGKHSDFGNQDYRAGTDGFIVT